VVSQEPSSENERGGRHLGQIIGEAMTSTHGSAAERQQLISGSPTPVAAPDLSLVISTIGRPEELRRMVTSIGAQVTDLAIELIVVDQSDDDATLQTLEGLDLDFPYRHVRSPVGLSLGRNTGLALATGRYVTFPDDDAWYGESMLEPAVAHLDRTPDIGGLCGRLAAADGSNSMLRWSKKAMFVTHRNHHRTSIGAVMVMRRSVAESIGGFDETLGPGTGLWYGSCEDADFVLRVIESGISVWYEPNLVVHHRDSRLDGGPDAARKSLAYGCGQGRMWRIHRFSWWWIAFLLGRRVVSSVLLAFQGHPQVGKSKRAWVRGALNGLMDRQPVDFQSSTDRPDVEPERPSPAPTAGEFVKSFRWRIIMSVVGIVSTFLLTALVARRLPDGELSLFYVLLASLGIAPILGRFGLNTKAVQELGVARAQDDWPTAVGIAHQAVRACFVPSVVTGPVIAISFIAWSSGDSFVSYALLASLILVTDSIRQTYSDIFVGLGMPRLGAVLAHQVRAVGVIIVLAVDQLLLGNSLTLTRLFVLMGVVGVAFVVIAHVRLWLIPHEGGAATHRLDIGSLALAGVPFLLVDLVAALVSRGDVWLASKAFDESTAAIYSTASVLAKQIGTPIGLANAALGPVAAGYLVRHRTADLERIIRMVVSALGLVLLPVFVVVVAAGDDLLALAYGERFVAAHPYLVALLTGNIAIVLLGLGTTVLVMAGRQRLAMVLSLGWLLIVGPAAIAAAYLGGPGALSVVSATATLGLLVVNAVAAWVTTGIRVYPRPASLGELARRWSVLDRRSPHQPA